MSQFLIKRLIGIIPLFFGITLISFSVIHLAPGSPVETLAAFNPKMTEQAKEKLTQLYGLDKPLAAQYGQWLGRLLRFDFGSSFADGEKVLTKIAAAAPVTLGINLLSLFLILLIGIPLGVYGAVNRGSTADNTLTLLTLGAFSLPTFWLALLAMNFFGVKLHILPVSGLYSVFHDDMTASQKVGDIARHLVLPVAVSALAGMAGISRFMRGSMTEALSQNYIRTARAKGLPENQVVYRHALKNALLPVVTLLGLSVPGLLGGSVLFETLFSIPGMGRLFFNAVFIRDYPVIMGLLVLGALLTLLGNLLADLAYGWADPRVRPVKS